MEGIYDRHDYLDERREAFDCNRKLKPATVGKRIDAAHPVAVAYLDEHAEKKKHKLIGNAVKNEAKKLSAIEKLKDESYADMSLRDVVEKYGTDPAFSDWLRATKLIEDINEKRIKNTTSEGELV